MAEIMTLQECKDQVASENGFDLRNLRDQEEFNNSPYYGELATKLYAQEKVKEALMLAAERATAYKESRFESVHYCECCAVVDRESVLSLETELLTKIEKE